MELDLAQIKIPVRQRTQIDDKKISELADSIQAIGLINAIIVDENNTLIAGECRLKAHARLGRKTIRVRKLSDLSEWEKQVIELEENIRREQLSPPDELAAKLKLHRLHVAKHGKVQTLSGEGRPKWKVEDTAQLLGISSGNMSETLQLAEAMEKDPELAKAKTIVSMKNEWKRKQEIKGRQLLAMLQVGQQRDKAQAGGTENSSPATFPTYEKAGITLVNTLCVDYIKSLPDSLISCLLTDPPWEVQFDDQFGSDPKTGLYLTQEMLGVLYPKLQEGSLCWMFCATKHLIRGLIYNLILTAGYRIYDTILIWHKPHVAHSSNPFRELKNDYEPCIVFSKGEGRNFSRPEFAVQSETIQGRRVHPAQKPLGVLRTIIELSTVENEIVIDPFCGSGMVGVGCKELNRKAILIDKDNRWYSTAVLEVEKCAESKQTLK
uniref:Putative methyltransferase n=1 Tax=viral metagenome TaxID=1070528 RepID=A0A6M3IK37_9ZZZZ